MINANLIKARIVELGMTQEQTAKQMGITQKTFSTKIKTGKLGLDEAEKLIGLLNINDPERYFFADNVAQ